MHRLLILLVAFCLACNQQARDNGTNDTLPPDGTELNDTLPVGPDTLLPSAAIRAPQGLYRVALPGGREQTLAFYKGQRYRLEESGGRSEPMHAAGKWAPAGGDLWLYSGDAVVGKYRWQADTLVYLLGGKLYPLQELQWALDNNVWRNKGKQGVEFFGVGNEPFWNIEIDEQKVIAFHLAEWPQPLRFSPVRPVVVGDSILYQTANDTATLRVVIYQRFCSDGMSDYTYDQQVRVVYNATVYNGCGLLFK